MSETDVAEELQEIVTEAKGSFDLLARVKNRPLRRKDVTIYTDEVLGEQIGHAVDVKNQFGLPVGRDRSGVVGDIDRLNAEIAALEGATVPDEEAIAEAKAKLEPLQAKLTELRAEITKTAVSFSLQAVPTIIRDDCRRQAKKALGIKGKISDDQAEDYNKQELAHLLAATVVSYTDVASGDTFDGLDVHTALGLREYLPAMEYGKLLNAQSELNFKNSISDAVTDDSDF